MENEAIQQLLIKYNEGRCTEEEKSLIEAWYLQYNEDDPQLKPRKVLGIGKRIFRELPGNQQTFLQIGLSLAAAASIFGILLTGGFKLWLSPHQPVQKVVVHEIRPGTSVAVLTLGNGQRINLSQVKKGQLPVPGQRIVKTAGGQLTYLAQGTQAANSVTNNIATPKGGQWQVTLQDGTRVWINSASSLTYPATFDKAKERIVQLSGEAYFEVTKDKAHPFIVRTGQQSVKVLGTHFNINAYADESAVKTTLAEGRVEVSAGNGPSQILAPGQQAVLKNGLLSRIAVNVDDELAWTKGSFHFSDQSIQSIMRQLSRWYDIDVQYEPGISYGGLHGRLSRNKNLSQVLSGLEATQSVHFKVEGRRITVMK